MKRACVAARIAASFVARLANIDILAAPRFALSAILAETPCGLARFWPGFADIITRKIEFQQLLGKSLAKIVTAQRVFHYVRGS
jgi:hypothetical protein